MLRCMTPIFLSGFLALMLSAARPTLQQPSLLIEITNVQPNRGKIVVELYKDKADWLKTPFRKLTLPADKSTKTASFTVPPGQYAVSIYQDKNENGTLDQNFLNIPKEPIGFGNNYRPFGKPKFESSVIRYNPGSKPEAINLFEAL
ncbi:DUF2141 domain-containing protein [Fibrisoma montanum]|uniref:DUF2141 domain-containing protein n=2 Tax=Fibrisoma montanum TaxID=2305895 RepID=A0A418ME27_9BACT|nr:DUF2141 domain-containing protein [Fibrisoma montanum]